MKITRRQLRKLIKESLDEMFTQEEWENLSRAEQETHKALDLMRKGEFIETGTILLEGLIEDYANQNDKESLTKIYNLLEGEYGEITPDYLEELWDDRWEHYGHSYGDTPVGGINQEADKWYNYYSGIYENVVPLLRKLRRLLGVKIDETN